jgi:uncharacterized membrane protein
MARLASPRSLQLRRIFGGLGGAAAGYALARELPLLPSALLCALLLATAGDLSRRLTDAGHWWGLIGAASGCLIGAASVLAAALQHPAAGDQLPQRAATLLLLAVAGAIAGFRLSACGSWANERRPRDLLRSASGLTTGIFAAMVTIAWLHSGLDPARAFSSRLSTSLTIVVTAVVGPGWLGHLMHSHNGGADAG